MREVKLRHYYEQSQTFVYISAGEPLTQEGAEIYHNVLLSGGVWELFTGLKDKNGKEIYEGDIIRYKSFDDKYYNQECPDLTNFHFWQETEDNETVEVIGNIHENEILLK